MARASPPVPRYDAYHEDSDDEAQIQASDTLHDHRAPTLVIPRDTGNIDEDDLEPGIVSPSPSRPRNNQAGSWRNFLARSVGPSPRPTQEDRSR